MPPHEQQTLTQLLAGSRLGATRHAVWLTQLRHDDPVFAQASILYPGDANEWQAATYLLTASQPVWDAFADLVLADLSLAPVILELDPPTHPGASSEAALIRWAAHFWDVSQSDVRFPHAFDELHFQRWITACHLYRRATPELPFTGGER